jgi:hypothetical protein
MAVKFLDSAPPPTEDAVTGKSGLLTAAWKAWFLRMPDTLSAIPSRVNVVELASQSSSISSTDFSGGALLGGLYRASWYSRVTSGAVTVTLRWTDGGTSQSLAGTTQSQTTMMRVDAGTPVTYSASYVGSGTYSLDVVLEKVKA